ncbi:ankyrin repeat domain-containing protein 61-like isoform X2 [Etheostoma cragini]|uniref:ankyrin repeat domain-containing protein 61-like isoform X1 n=1 Tax=Etheostoma cragini TaxID=417921 RepID=UPI00155E069F|nr:ankyrin repeat domain-containing protein 61-like isoform X1 [Etheostoma cragini]XP_034716563.1 ankyrin repeat domain-containing protein 61-like isoform X2 [Etheostoma cragini]
MLEESKGHGDKSGNTVKFLNNEFYTGIIDEDSGCIEDMSKTYGSNFLIMIQGTPGDVFWKGLTTLPLHLAASYRRVKSMQSLLSTGADPELRDQLGRTTLHLVIAGWPRILTTWPKPGSKFRTAVIGVRSQAEACLRLLCEHGVNVNAEVEGSHQTALHLSVRYVALSAVHILASYGADVNAVDSTGMTPLHMAAGILHKDLMASLIKDGADINMGVTHSGNTPLHLAAVAMTLKTTQTPGDDISCFSELLEHGAEVNAVNKAGLTPLQEACSMGNTELVELLLRYGANINKLTKAGESCLFLFLNHRPNVRNNSLLLKLLSLTSRLTVYNHNGNLPSTLTLPCFFKQRDQLLNLTQQPRRLQDICKSVIYLKHVHDKREELREILPEKLFDFVFNYWEKKISFVTDVDQDSFNYFLNITSS